MANICLSKYCTWVRQSGATLQLLSPKGLIYSTLPIIGLMATCIRFVKHIILLYISVTRKDLGLGEEHMTLVIFNTIKVHKEDGMESFLLENNVLSVIVPSNCTDLLQPLDLSVNKPLKDHLRCSFKSWYSEHVSKQLEERKEPEDVDVKVDTRLLIMKPLSARWITSAYDYLRSHSGIVHGGFIEAGIVEALDQDETEDQAESDEDIFQDPN